MKLWLISADTKGYDVYSDAVVAAKTEEQARGQHPNGYENWNGTAWQSEIDGRVHISAYDYNWVNAPDVTAELIGIAKPGTAPGIICASFHAG